MKRCACESDRDTDPLGDPETVPVPEAEPSTLPTTTPTPLPHRDRTMPDLIDKTYNKIEKIGEGSYGIVYKAIHKEDETLVALKKIRINSYVDSGPLSTTPF